MAEGIGVDGIHCVSGLCDLCGDVCDANTQELNVLTCTFKNCQDLPYHQDCLEKYLKSIRLERNRKTGFKCPRGCGKGSAHKEPCPGKIDKSHPIHPRNEEQKKKKKAKLPDVAVLPAARPAKTKEDKKAEKAAAAKTAAVAAAPAGADRGKAATASSGSLKAATAAASANHAVKARPPPPPDPKAKLAEAVAAARRELAAATGSKSRDSTPPHPPAAAAPEYKTLDMYYRENAASNSSLSSMSSSAAAAAAAAVAPPVANAWASKPPPVPAASSAQAAAGASAASRLPPKQAAAPAAAAAAAAEPNRLHSAQSSLSVLSVQSSQYSSRPESPTRHLLPPPPPPPPPLPQYHHGAEQQQQLLASSGLPHAPSLHPQGSSASLQSSSSQGLAGAAQLPVGAEYADDEQPQLTKAQRKNLKRAEKKKKGTQPEPSSGGGVGSDGRAAAAASSNGVAAPAASSSSNVAQSSSSAAAGAAGQAGRAAAAAGSMSGAADEDAAGVMYELAVQALLANKTLALVASLQRLGFVEWQAAAAVQRHGSDLEEAVAWLLEGGATTPEAAAAVSSGCVAEVNIHEELGLLEALASALPQIPRCKLYQTVADTGGDLDAAAAVCLQHVAAVEEVEAADVAVAAAEVQAAADTAADAAGLASEAGFSGMLLGSVSPSPQQPQQLAASPETNMLDTTGFAAAPSLYNAAAAAAAAAGCSSLGASDSTFAGWLGDSSLSVLDNSQQYGQQPFSNSSFGGLQGGLGASSSAAATAAGGASLSFLPNSSSSGLGSSIWANNDQLGNSSGGAGLWGTDAAAGGSLFGGVSGSGLGGFDGSGLGLTGIGAPGLGLLQQQQQQHLSVADPVLDSAFGSNSIFNQPAAGDVSGAGLLGTAAGQQSAAPSLQQSRLFQSYGWRQQPLFGGTEQPQQQQQGVHGEEDQDLEGLMATLMCH